MKKVNYLVIGAAGLLLASCSQDPMGPTVAQKGDGNFNISVKIPALNIDTRADFTAFGEGKVANNLYYAVYDANANNKLVISTQTGEFTVDGDYLTTEVSLNLATGKKYKIAFFAQSEASADVYSFNDDEATVTVNYENMTNENNLADAYDCFYKVIEVTPSSTETTATAELTRPLAQVNWGTDDLGVLSVKDENAYGENGKYIETYLTVTPYQTLNLFNGEVSNPTAQPLKLGYFTSPSAMDPAIAFPVEGYEYVAMNYLLVPAESSVLSLTLNITNDGGNGDLDIPIEVASVPVQANYRTNIYGNLLSDDVEVNVVKDPTWGTPDYLISPEAVMPPMVDGKYEVSTQGHLNWMAENVSNPQYNDFADQTFVLSQDVYLTQDITPIGTKDNPFKGTFEGNEKTIYNLSYTSSDDAQYIGLFGYIDGADAVVENFTIENVTINNESGKYIGAVVGNLAKGTVKDIVITGKVDINAPKGYYIGGFIGRTGGSTIENLNMNVTDTESIILGGNYVAGIVGLNSLGVAEMSILKSNVSVSGLSYAGGIIGLIGNGISGEKDVTLSNCNNYGEIINRSVTNAGNGYYIGGIAGGWGNLTNTTVIFDECYNHGNLSWPNWTGSDSDDFEYRTKNDITGVGSEKEAQGTLIINPSINGSDNVAEYHWYPNV